MNFIRFNNIRLREKLLILYLLAVFIPIVLTNVIFYQVTTHNIKKQKLEDMSLTMEKVKNEFLAKINDAVGISSVYYTDNILNDDLEQDYSSPYDYIEVYNAYILGNLNKYSPIYKAIQAITIYTDNSTVIGSGGVNLITEDVKKSIWYKEITDAHTSFPIVLRTDNNGSGRDTFSVIRKLNYFSSNNTKQKILKIDLNLGIIKPIFDNQIPQGNQYLLNEHDRIEYTTDPDVDWKKQEVDYKTLIQPKGSINFETEYTNINYLNHWRIIGVVPEKQLLEEVRKSKVYVIYLACANLVLPLFIIVIMTRSLHVRLIRILKHMKMVKTQNFEIIKHVEAKDEIGQLTVEFNRMTLQIKSLIDDVYIAEIQKKDLELKRKQAQLHALQSQINPHFLFNALETIRMRSLMKHEEETAKIIKNMAKIFRRSFTWGKDWVTIREEMDLILCFLEIQKYRFGDKLDYVIKVDEAAYDCKIPKMTFLPFVENASIHGIESMQGNGRIEMHVERQNDFLIYTLKDNGIGFTQELLQKLLAYLENEDHMGESVGIKNVYYRLKMYYSETADFHIESEYGKGTLIRIKLPCNGGI